MAAAQTALPVFLHPRMGARSMRPKLWQNKPTSAVGMEAVTGSLSWRRPDSKAASCCPAKLWMGCSCWGDGGTSPWDDAKRSKAAHSESGHEILNLDLDAGYAHITEGPLWCQPTAHTDHGSHKHVSHDLRTRVLRVRARGAHRARGWAAGPGWRGGTALGRSGRLAGVRGSYRGFALGFCQAGGVAKGEEGCRAATAAGVCRVAAAAAGGVTPRAAAMSSCLVRDGACVRETRSG